METYIGNRKGPMSDYSSSSSYDHKATVKDIDLDQLKKQQMELLKLQIHVQQSLSKIENRLNTFSSKRKRQWIRTIENIPEKSLKSKRIDKGRRSCETLFVGSNTQNNLKTNYFGDKRSYDSTNKIKHYQKVQKYNSSMIADTSLLRNNMSIPSFSARR